MADGSVVIDSKLDQSGFKTGLANIGKIAIAGVAAATAAVGALTKAAVESYGEYEQLVGGIETLYKDSSKKMVSYADSAYKTAQMSENDYMSLATSFSASLLQSVGGDTEKAAEKANSAIIDMADNANKMGTDMQSIQYAYQGFAKQNYTMLDNLKLGYGGTKEEMQRLLEDATKLSGVKYDLSSYADIVDAIHVVQTELGITGTSANEASSTIQGSIAMAKSAYANLVTGLGDSNADISSLMDNLISSATAVLDNLIPVITTVIKAIPTAINALIPTITDTLPQLVADLLPQLLDCATTLLDGLMAGMPAIFSTLTQIIMSACQYIIDSLPMITELAINLVQTFAQGYSEALPGLISTIAELIPKICTTVCADIPAIIQVGIDLLLSLVQGLLDAIPQLIDSLPEIIDALINGVLSSIPLIINAGIQLLTALVTGLPEIINKIVDVLPEIITSIIDAVLNNIPAIIQAGIDLLIALVRDLPTIITTIVSALPEIISSITGAILDNIPTIIKAGIDLFVSLIKALPKIIVEIVKAVPQIIKGLISAFESGKERFANIGENLIKGLWEGIKNVKDWIWGKIKGFFSGIVDGIKDFFGIHSPSKVFKDSIGKNLILGLSEGIDSEGSTAVKSMTDIAKSIAGTKFIANTNGMFDNIDAGDTVRHLTTIVDEQQENVAKSNSAKVYISKNSDYDDSDNTDGLSDEDLIKNASLNVTLNVDGREFANAISVPMAKVMDWNGK